MGNVFMKKCDDVFKIASDFLLKKKISKDYDFLIVDFHGEITSEKMAIGKLFDGHATLVVGTHTHVPTNDARVLKNGTSYITDAGMCGPHEASLWVDFPSVIQNFKYPFKTKFEMKEDGPRVFNSVLIEFENKTPIKIERIDRVID